MALPPTGAWVPRTALFLTSTIRVIRHVVPSLCFCPRNDPFTGAAPRKGRFFEYRPILEYTPQMG